jgi:hypothetical protein
MLEIAAVIVVFSCSSNTYRKYLQSIYRNNGIKKNTQRPMIDDAVRFQGSSQKSSALFR